MNRIFAIAYNTYKEAIRDRILYGFLFFAVCMLLFSLVLGKLALDQSPRITIDVGLTGISLFSVLIAIFVGVSLLNKEIQKRTIFPVLSKPVTREQYLLGKFVGVQLVLWVLMALMILVFIPLLYYQGGHLTSGLLLALWLIGCEVSMIIAMSLFFTSFSSPFLSGLMCLGLFIGGRNADLVAEMGRQQGVESFEWVFVAVSNLLPNFYLFYPSGKVVEGTFASVHAQFVESGYLWSAIGYSTAVTALLLTAAALVLKRREFL